MKYDFDDDKKEDKFFDGYTLIGLAILAFCYLAAVIIGIIF